MITRCIDRRLSKGHQCIRWCRNGLDPITRITMCVDRCCYKKHRCIWWHFDFHDLIAAALAGCTSGTTPVYPVASGWTGAEPPVYLVQLTLLVFSWFDLELILTLSFCYSKCFVEFFWAVLDWIEQVCIVSKAKTIQVKLLTREPLLIVRSLTLNL